MDVFEMLLTVFGIFVVGGIALAIIATRSWLFVIPIIFITLINSYPAVALVLVFLLISIFRCLEIKDKKDFTTKVIIIDIIAISAGYSAVVIGAAFLIGEVFSGIGSIDGSSACTRSFCP